MNTLVDMISGMEVKEDDDEFMNAVDYMFKGLEKRKPDCFAVKQYKKYKLASGKTAKSILISCGARLAPFDIPQLREIMSYDELELDRMGDRRTATFFCISDTDSTYNFLVALAFSQMFNLLCERADNVHGGRLPHHVRVLWDEAANTGQVPGLEKLVAVIRSREISLCLLYQQLAQCKAIYDKNAETILGNMDSVLFLGGREASTIKEISENWLGKATISMQTEGRSRGNSESYSQNTQRLGRELMTPSELATMPGDRCVLQLRGLPPFYSRKYDLKQHPNYRFTAEADKVKNAFDLDRLINRRRQPGLNEMCEVFNADVPDDALTGEDEDILNYREKTATGARTINKRLRDIVNPASPDKPELVIGQRLFRLGDKVMQNKNTEEVSNGDIGYITGVESMDDSFTVEVDFGDSRLVLYQTVEALGHLELAYATTIHKSQGGEHMSVLISIQGGRMLQRSLIYTAITRAKLAATIVGSWSAVAYAIENNNEQERCTHLAARLNELQNCA